MRIAITGVTGFVGRHLAARALAAGYDVVGFSRRPWTGAPYVPLESRYFLELPDRPQPSVLDDVDAVVHLAIASQSAAPAVVDAVNRLGAELLFAASRESGVARFVFVSSQSAHDGATSAYGRSKLAVERALSDAPAVVIVRPGLVYGDADDGLIGRATRTAARLRAFPVIGGRAARVQPIEVGALCDALRALATIDDPPRSVDLGDADARPLGEFVRERAQARFGVTPLAVPVPIGLARAGIRLVTKLHLPSPISEENLDGIEAFVPMDTAADTALVEGLVADAGLCARASVAEVEPRRVIIVGAGRVGLVHALTAAHHQGMVLVGVVDLDRAAMRRLVAFAGPALAMFTDLDEARAELHPDAAIVCTPPSSHVPIARKLLAAGVDVFVEKPVAATDDDRRAIAAAVDASPGRYLSTGYLGGLLPHVAAIAADLHAGRFGTPRSFEGHAFVSRVEAGSAERRDMWELDPNVSGGGALVNLGVHVLAMTDVLLGPAEVERATLVVQPGRATEDGAFVALRAGGVPGTFATAWHLPGFDMPENHLRIDTDRGFVVCTTSCAAFVDGDETVVVHQVDADPGFDLAPMDAGGAFWVEQDLLARRVEGANSLERAIRVEGTISRVYETAARAAVAVAAAAPPSRSGSAAASDGGSVLPDLRGAPPGIASGWSGPALVGTASGSPADTIVALPDAPAHFRTLTNKGAATLVRELGAGNLGRAAVGISPRSVLSAGGRAWEALLALLRAELRRVPRDFRGALVVDAYITDLATATGNIAVVSRALDDVRAHCPGARAGVEVNAVGRLVPHATALASRLDLVVALGTPTPASTARLRDMLDDSVELVVKTGVLPSELLEVAWDHPARWTGGAGRLVVHWPGAPGLRDLHAVALARAKRAAGAEQVIGTS